MVGVLDGVRVLDYGRFIAAPWCSALLADMGADVLRVEKREGGEDRWVQSVAAGGEGGTFLQCNRNKRSLTLDSTTPEGAEVTRRLVERSDIVIANMPLKGMRASRLDYDSLRQIKPDIILASATAYGEGGPYSDRIGFDGAGQVMSGATYRQGLPDMPIRTVVPQADFGTALTMTIGVMMALYHRLQTGEGQHVEAALLPTALMLSNAFLIERHLLGVDKPRMGNRGASVAPCDLYEVTDGWVLLQVAGQPKAQALEALEGAKLPAAPMHSTQDVLEDPHIEAMGYLKSVPFPGASRDVPIIETPFRMSKTPGTIRQRAPLLGEHTDEVLAEIGYGAAEIIRLRECAIV